MFFEGAKVEKVLKRNHRYKTDSLRPNFVFKPLVSELRSEAKTECCLWVLHVGISSTQAPDFDAWQKACILL
jgi:hypothetical protein